MGDGSIKKFRNPLRRNDEGFTQLEYSNTGIYAERPASIYLTKPTSGDLSIE